MRPEKHVWGRPTRPSPAGWPSASSGSAQIASTSATHETGAAYTDAAAITDEGAAARAEEKGVTSKPRGDAATPPPKDRLQQSWTEYASEAAAAAAGQ